MGKGWKTFKTTPPEGVRIYVYCEIVTEDDELFWIQECEWTAGSISELGWGVCTSNDAIPRLWRERVPEPRRRLLKDARKLAPPPIWEEPSTEPEPVLVPDEISIGAPFRKAPKRTMLRSEYDSLPRAESEKLIRSIITGELLVRNG